MALDLESPDIDAARREREFRLAFNSPEARVERDRERRAAGMLPTAEERYRAIMEIAARARSRPVLDSRTPEEILGYDEDGLPT